MKRSVKRILCGALSLTLASTLAVEHALRMTAETLTATTSASAAFKNVTGEFDTTALREQNFNDSVMQTETTPTYETRTVVVSLKSGDLVDAANADGESVSSYINTWSGQMAADKIRSQQDDFLSKLTQTGIPYKLEQRYDAVLNGVAIEVNTKHVSTIKQLANVDSVVITTSYAVPESTETGSSASDITNATSVYATGIYDTSAYTEEYGKGSVVAILDTGLDYTHEAFQNDPASPTWSKDYVEKLLEEYNLTAEGKAGTLDINDVYVSSKVPFAFDYADDDADVYPSYSNHGTHVAGIIGGYNKDGYTDKDGNAIDDTAFRGVVPDAQLVICKVFTDDLDDEELGGAEAENIIAALDDCVTIGVDVINMSLGTSCGFTTTDDGDEEGDLLNEVYEKIKKAGISLVCAASNDYSAGYGGVYGTNLTSNPDSGTVGSPSTFSASLSVASISGQKSPYMKATDEDGNEIAAFYEEARDENGNPYDFAEQLLGTATSGEFNLVVIPNTGRAGDYTTKTQNLLKGDKDIALVKRGDNTFQEKVEIAKQMGAEAIIVYNNVAGIIRMNLGEIEKEDRIPAVSIDMDAGEALKEAAGGINKNYPITIDRTYEAGPFMSEFSSWGPTHDLKLKPEITAHGGEITSTVPGGYGEQSGTSMASPNMAGVMALIRNYIESDDTLSALVAGSNGSADPVKVNRLANQLIMSTATTVRDQGGRVYSPRKQGAGLGSLENVIDKTSAYLSVNNADNDYRPKLELGDDPDKDGVYVMSFQVHNFGSSDLTFEKKLICLTETIAKDGLAVAEKSYTLSPDTESWSVEGGGTYDNGIVTVNAGSSATINVRVVLSKSDREYLDQFENGMYVEGFLQLISKDNGDQCDQCDLSLPYLAFYGDWESAPMLDYTAYEIAASEQDSSVLDANKLKASVWATQAYTSYYNEKYILPMGSYVYLVADDDDPVYTNMDYCAVSRYNIYDPDNEDENYLTSTAIKAVYAGLLRNARVVKYKLYDVNTGELILEEECNRVGKAYAGGGSAVPANVQLDLSPEAEGLMANGQYRMDLEFYMNDPDVYTAYEGEGVDRDNSMDTFTFTFTVDYEAPVLEDVRVRYYDYKDGTKEKQKIYLDIDVYDNNYAQAVMLCYPTLNAEGDKVLQLVTEYPTPVRNPNKNGTTTVTIEITDIYEEYGEQLYLQIDDYALNRCLYQINLTSAQSGLLPENGEFELAEGEDEITLGIYETHKVSLVYEGDANLSNFGWTSVNPTVAAVKNGEIVGLKTGTTTIKVHDRNQNVRTIKVTVTDETARLATVPSLSFNVIKTSTESLAKATGVVEVNAGEEFQLEISPDPWYHPMTGLTFVWESKNEAVATVDQEGNVKTLKKGTAVITAKVYRNGKATSYSCSVTLRVPDEFDVSSYSLNDYHGVGYNEEIDIDGDGTAEKVLVLPTDLNIMYIGEDAFKDNDNIEYIVIPSSVTEIKESAFENCSALKGVYFVSVNHRVTEAGEDSSIDWSDLSLVNKKAFYNCSNLETVDLANVKTITIAHQTFADCVSLKTVIDWQSIGTMHHYAFANCVSLEKVELDGLFVAGNYVFQGCTGIKKITTGKFTAIGNYMFDGCTGLTKVELYGARIGNGAFRNCVNLASVTFESPENVEHEFEIGAYAFENCGSRLESGNLTVTLGGEKIRVLGSYAFKGSSLASFEMNMSALEVLGTNPFEDTNLTTLTIDDSFDMSKLVLSGIPFEGITLKVADGSRLYREDPNRITKGTELVYVNPTWPDKAIDGDFVSIGAYAFAGNKTVKQVVFNKATEIGEGAFENSAVQQVTLGEVKDIPAYAFRNSKITEINLRSVETIGDYAFAGSPIKTVGVGDKLSSLGKGAFQGCKALQNIDLKFAAAGDGSVGSFAFAECINLRSVMLYRVKTVGDYVFYGASALNDANIIAETETLSLGSWLFAGTPVKNVSLGGAKVIGEGTFYDCAELGNISLGEVEVIGDYAFAGCSSLTRLTLDSVKTIGNYAFYGCERLSIAVLPIENTANTENTASADEDKLVVGAGAFADCTSLQYINLEHVDEIGSLAFMNTKLQLVSIDDAQKIGDGAFAGITTLKTIQIGDKNENENFVVIGNVLYRYIDKDEGTYALVCYPSGLDAAIVTVKTEDKDGKTTTATKRVYEIEEGTLLVQAYAFFGLKSGAVDEVVVPYCVKTIGDAAFYASDILEYTFESIQAPTLETSYRDEVATTIENMATENTAAYYRGYYYTNFQTYFYLFTKYGTETSELVINYPENGKGYDNYLYKTYFGVRNTTGIHITDETRACREAIEAMYDAETVKGWSSLTVNAANTAMVTEFAEVVKSAHAKYNNIAKDTAQLALLGEDNAQKLSDVEAALRTVKKSFNIAVNLSSAEVSAASKHRAEYAVGETFDMTGIVVELTYDDYSTEIADTSKLTLVSTQTLSLLDNYVEIVYQNGEVKQSAYVMITVLETLPTTADENEGGVSLGVLLGVVGATVVVFGFVTLDIFLRKRRKAQAAAGAEEVEESVETPVETTETVETDGYAETVEKSEKTDEKDE